VRIQYAKEGGMAYIPALARPVTIDTETLSPEQAQALEELVRKAAFFDLPQNIGKLRRGAADYQTYTITVAEGGRSHSIRVTDLGERPDVAALVQALEKEAKEIRRGKTNP
jgi:hypothetical protein